RRRLVTGIILVPLFERIFCNVRERVTVLDGVCGGTVLLFLERALSDVVRKITDHAGCGVEQLYVSKELRYGRRYRISKIVKLRVLFESISQRAIYVF